MEERNKAALITSIIALVVSVSSAIFSGLQWREARQARLDQRATAKQNESDQKAARQIAQAQTMAADRSVILQQRKQDPKLARDESDMPKMAAFNLAIDVLPWHAADAEEFLRNTQKTVSVTNVGRSTAYYVIAVNQSSIGDADGMTSPAPAALQASVMEPIMLAPSKQFSVSADPRKFTPDELSAFRNGDASYYLAGTVQYQDVFQRSHKATWCYEFHMKKGVRATVENKPCTSAYDKVSGVMIDVGERIEAESKWDQEQKTRNGK